MSRAPSLIEEQEQLLTAQTELTQHLLRFVEEQLARAERAEEQCQQLMARLEALRAQNVLQEQEVDEAEQKLADASLAQTRAEAERDEARLALAAAALEIHCRGSVVERIRVLKRQYGEEHDRLMVALEVEQHFWEAMQRLGQEHPMYLTREQVTRRLEALDAALEGKRG